MREHVRTGAEELYWALETIIRQNAGENRCIGHDAIIEGRRTLAKASNRSRQRIDWSKERLGVKLCGGRVVKKQ